MKKKMIAAVLAASMVVSLAACGNTSSTNAASQGSGSATEENASGDSRTSGDASFTVGYPTAASYNAVMSAMHENRTAVAEAAGGELITEIFDFTPDGTVTAVEKLIQEGCDGVYVTPVADSILPTIVSMCEDSEVYFVLSMRSVSDPDVKEIVEASPYYAGDVYEDEYSAGYEMGKALHEAGGTTYAIIAPQAGDTTGALREEGLAAAAEEFGMTQVAEYRNPSQASDSASAVESFIASYPDLDGIIRLGTNATGDVTAICTALQNAGKAGDIKFITIDTEEGCDQYLEDGTITATLRDLLVQDSIAASVLLVNAVQGNQLEGAKEVKLSYSEITEADELRLYYEYIACEEPVYSAEEIQANFLKSSGAELTTDDVSAMANEMTATSVKERKEAQ